MILGAVLGRAAKSECQFSQQHARVHGAIAALGCRLRHAKSRDSVLSSAIGLVKGQQQVLLRLGVGLRVLTADLVDALVRPQRVRWSRLRCCATLDDIDETASLSCGQQIGHKRLGPRAGRRRDMHENQLLLAAVGISHQGAHLQQFLLARGLRKLLYLLQLQRCGQDASIRRRAEERHWKLRVSIAMQTSASAQSEVRKHTTQ